MRVAVLLVCVLGCGRIWDPESYRGEGIDVGIEDASLDANQDAGDVDPDAAVDATLDAPLADVGTPDTPDEDASDAGVCTVVDRVGPIEVRSDISDMDVRYGGVGPALRVFESDVVIQNIDITLSGAATAIQIEPDAQRVQLENIRIQKTGAGTAPNQFAIVVQGPIGGVNDGVFMDNLEIRGMEAIRLSRVSGARVTRIRVVNPRGFGMVDHAATRHHGILFEEVESSTLNDFAITGADRGTPQVTHALRCVESQELTLSNGYVSAPSVDFPVQMVGRRNSTPRNEMINVDILNNPRGIELRGTSHWDLTNVSVTRTAGCMGADYAFAHVGVASDMVSCTACIWTGCEEAAPTLGQLMANPGTPVAVFPPQLEFCFLSF